MIKKVIVREYVEMVRVVEVPVKVTPETEMYAHELAVDKMRDVGLSEEDVVNAGMRLISDFDYVDNSSEYEPEYT